LLNPETSAIGTQRSNGIYRIREMLVVAVIEEKEMAGAAQYIEFKVYRSSTDPNRVLGSWRFAAGGPNGILIDQSKPDSPVQIEFSHAMDCADQHGIPFVWVDDPEELFAPYIRR
jgi:hypothetical protein